MLIANGPTEFEIAEQFLLEKKFAKTEEGFANLYKALKHFDKGVFTMKSVYSWRISVKLCTLSRRVAK